MGAARWDSAQLDRKDPVRDLAEYLRFLLQREGLTPRQLAADPDIPYGPAMLYRFFSGQALPPPQVIEVVARRCGGDHAALQIAYDRARRGAMADVGRRVSRRAPRHAYNGGSRSGGRNGVRSRLLTAGIGFSAVGAIVLATALYTGLGTQRPAGAASRPAPPVPAGRASSPPPAPPREDRPAPEQIGKTAPARKTPDATPKPKPPPPRPVELLDNTTFTGSIAPWEDDDVEAFADDGLLQVDVPSSGEDGFVDSNEFALRSDRTYVLSFDAAADEDVEMAAVVLRRDDDPALVREVGLDFERQRFSFTFEPDARTSSAIVSFEFDTDADDHTVAIDNVSLRELP